MEKQGDPACDYDVERKACGCAGLYPHQHGRNESAVAVVHHPYRKKKQRHGFVGVSPHEVDDRKNQQAGKLHNNPAHTRTELNTLFFTFEPESAAIGRSTHKACGKYQQRVGKTYEKQCVVKGITGVPGHDVISWSLDGPQSGV